MSCSASSAGEILMLTSFRKSMLKLSCTMLVTGAVLISTQAAYAQVDKRGEYFNARFLKEGIKGILSFDFVKEAESEVENFSMVKQDQYWVANSFKERGLKLFFIESDFEVLISEVASSFEMDEAVEE